MEIEIKNLDQFYGKKKVLDNINLTIGAGMFGLLGRNGAGKSTLMKTLATLLPLQAGEVSLAGIQLQQRKAIREIIGYLPQDFSMYGNLSAYEALDYIGVLAGLSTAQRRQRIPELLEQVNLTVHRRVKVRAMSGGMKQRLGIAQALLNDPQILIVDEPTAGLDPEERLRFRNLLSELSEHKVVLLSTHIAGDIEAAAEELAVIEEGRLLFKGRMQHLLAAAEGQIFTVELPRTELAAIKKQVQVISLQAEGAAVKVRFIGAPQAPVMKHPLAVAVVPTLEDAYLYCLAGRSSYGTV